MNRGLGAVDRQKPLWRKALGTASIALGVVVLLCVLVFLSFPTAFLQKFVEARITKGFAASYPGYSIRISGIRFDVMKNRIACDSVLLARNDSSFSGSIAAVSVSGVHWLGLLRGTSVDPRTLAASVVEAGEVDMAFQGFGYGLRCGPLRLSVPDSEIVVEALELHPLVSDAQFFEGSKFRKTWFEMSARRCRLAGLAYVDLLQGENYHARSLQFQDVFADVLINKDKPSADGSPVPRMPDEILSSVKDTVGLDSLIITDCRLRYRERFAMGVKPATLTFDRVQGLVTGVASHAERGAGASIHGRGTFMGGGTVNLVMSIPLTSPQFSLRYSGSLSGMDLSKLNPWIEPSDQTRIKTGVLESAAFDINVRAGVATGTVRAVYRDLIVASINSRTGSENALVDRFASWVAKNVTIRKTNTPDRSGAMKFGTVRYARKQKDPFFGFAWFALRSGVGDIVGF
jgi:hypothetical protein